MTEKSDESHSLDDSVGDKLNDALVSERRTLGQQPGRRKVDKEPVAYFLVLMCVLVGLVILAGFVGYQEYIARTWRESIDQKISESNTKIELQADMAPRLDELKMEVDILNEDLAGLVSAKAQEQELIEQQLSKVLETVDRKLSATSADWLLGEVEYLIRLANRRVAMETDVAGARNLLIAADNILKTTELLTAINIRQAIAEDIIKLDSVELVDRDGIYVKLTAIYAVIDQLKLHQSNFKQVEEEPSEPADVESGWTNHLLRLLKEAGTNLKSLVDFRRNETDIKPVLPPQEEYYLRQNLRLKIELARIAVLRSNQIIYKQSITEAAGWMREHFDVDDKTTQTGLNGLETLAGLKVTMDLPEISASLEAVQEYLLKFRKTGVLRP